MNPSCWSRIPTVDSKDIKRHHQVAALFKKDTILADCITCHHKFGEGPTNKILSAIQRHQINYGETTGRADAMSTQRSLIIEEAASKSSLNS